jgi:uncharacterized protein (TIGR02246 family)
MTSNITATLSENDTAVRAVFTEVSRAWADGDAEAFADWCADGASAVLPGVRLQDRDAIRSAMAAAFAGSLRGSRRIHEVRRIRFLGDGTAIALTDSATVFPGEAEVPSERREWATWVLARHGDRWLIEAYHGCPVDAG